MPREPVTLIECPRDAWQGVKKIIRTELKVRYLRALLEAGFKHIDAVSFVSPRAVPQMADSEEVLKQLHPREDVEVIGIVVNERGAERAIASGRVTTLGYPCSISPTFLRRNQNQSPEENLDVLKAIKNRADTAKIDMVVYLSMAFGNPYRDPWGESQIVRAVKAISDNGIRTISLADTVGVATPQLINRVVNAVIEGWGAHAPSRAAFGVPAERLSEFELGVHLHSRRENAAEKILAAYDAGCRRFDSAIGGLGGCPFAQDHLVGNTPTESVLEALRQREVDTSIFPAVDDVIPLSEEIAGRFV